MSCLLFVQKFCLQAEPRVTKLETDFQTAKVMMESSDTFPVTGKIQLLAFWLE